MYDVRTYVGSTYIFTTYISTVHMYVVITNVLGEGEEVPVLCRMTGRVPERGIPEHYYWDYRSPLDYKLLG